MTRYILPPNLDKLSKEELIDHIKMAYKWLAEAVPAIDFVQSLREFNETNR